MKKAWYVSKMVPSVSLSKPFPTFAAAQADALNRAAQDPTATFAVFELVGVAGHVPIPVEWTTATSSAEDPAFEPGQG